ncbi:hypothetical protein PG997_001047 [Apiospora hydei]|uniref:Mediator of RNA polymerase II transcription subunit 21 n=1 Tax=Apiospora hydei TaxID=1337664 RepID=A0ABR1XCF3_9PEZI
MADANKADASAQHPQDHPAANHRTPSLAEFEQFKRLEREVFKAIEENPLAVFGPDDTNPGNNTNPLETRSHHGSFRRPLTDGWLHLLIVTNPNALLRPAPANNSTTPASRRASASVAPSTQVPDVKQPQTTIRDLDEEISGLTEEISELEDDISHAKALRSHLVMMREQVLATIRDAES